MDIIDELVKSRHSGPAAGTGVQGILNQLKTLDSGFRRNDETRTKGTFYENIIIWLLEFNT